MVHASRVYIENRETLSELWQNDIVRFLWQYNRQGLVMLSEITYV